MREFDHDAQAKRDRILPGFLDLTSTQWEAWLARVDIDSLPFDLNRYAAVVISSLRLEGDHPRARYLQTMATMADSTLQWFVDEVGGH